MKITLDADYFEHLLSCLANQKFIGEAPPNGDALAQGKEVYEGIQKHNQEVIDTAWKKGMDILVRANFSAKGGKASAKKLSPKERKLRATKASHSRKPPKKTTLITLRERK